MTAIKVIFEGLTAAQLFKEAYDRSYPVYGRLEGVWTKVSPFGACRALRTKRELEQVLTWELAGGNPHNEHQDPQDQEDPPCK